jgi:SAM-dependent methyltransferase
MNSATVSSGAVDWLEVAACPDCLEPLQAESGTHAAACTMCGRLYQGIENGLALLPRGREPRQRVVAPTGASWRSKFVSTIYTRHNQSSNVRRAISHVTETLQPGDWGLNLGSADTELSPRILNLDIVASPNVDVVATATRLPFRTSSLGCVVSQEVFEHLRDPLRAAREVFRVLRPGGLFYFQVPFIIGFHSGPHDYWRFTHRGVRQLLGKAGFEVAEVGAAVGAGTSMYRISVELAALLAGTVHRRLYFPAKGLSAVMLAPLRWLDYITTNRREINRIAAGFFAIARKPAASEDAPRRRRDRAIHNDSPDNANSPTNRAAHRADAYGSRADRSFKE